MHTSTQGGRSRACAHKTAAGWLKPAANGAQVPPGDLAEGDFSPRPRGAVPPRTDQARGHGARVPQRTKYGSTHRGARAVRAAGSPGERATTLAAAGSHLIFHSIAFSGAYVGWVRYDDIESAPADWLKEIAVQEFDLHCMTFRVAGSDGQSFHRNVGGTHECAGA